VTDIFEETRTVPEESTGTNPWIFPITIKIWVPYYGGGRDANLQEGTKP
jgi:hypothetical protein